MPLEILLGVLLRHPIWDSYSVSLLGVHESTALLFSGEALGIYIEGITPKSGIIMLYSNLYGNQFITMLRLKSPYYSSDSNANHPRAGATFTNSSGITVHLQL